MLKNTGNKKGLKKNIIAGAAIAAVVILVLASLTTAFMTNSSR